MRLIIGTLRTCAFVLLTALRPFLSAPCRIIASLGIPASILLLVYGGSTVEVWIVLALSIVLGVIGFTYDRLLLSIRPQRTEIILLL